METAEEVRQAKTILEKTVSDQASLIMDLISQKFRREDYETLAKLNAYHRKGYLTDNEYVTRITVILHEIEIAEHNQR